MFYINSFNTNSVDPDQTPRSVASDLGLYCLQMSLLWDHMNKWVNQSSQLTLLSNNTVAYPENDYRVQTVKPYRCISRE